MGAPDTSGGGTGLDHLPLSPAQPTVDLASDLNPWIVDVLHDVDKTLCPPSQLDFLARWAQWIKAHPRAIPYQLAEEVHDLSTPIRICRNIQSTLNFLPTQLTQDLIRCHAQGLPVVAVDFGGDTPLLSDPVVELLNSVMFPLKSRPLAAPSIPITSEGLGQLEVDHTVAYNVYADEKPQLIPMPKLKHTSYNPVGHLSRPRLSPYPGDSVVYHCYGRAFWMTFPPVESNIDKLLSCPSSTSQPFSCLEQWMAKLDGLQVVLVEKEGTTLILPAGTIYAHLAVSTTIHTVAPVVSEHSLAFSKLYTDKLIELDHRHPDVMSWVSSLEEGGFLAQWQKLVARKRVSTSFKRDGAAWLRKVRDWLESRQESGTVEDTIFSYGSRTSECEVPHNDGEVSGSLDMQASEGHLSTPACSQVESSRELEEDEAWSSTESAPVLSPSDVDSSDPDIRPPKRFRRRNRVLSSTDTDSSVVEIPPQPRRTTATRGKRKTQEAPLSSDHDSDVVYISAPSAALKKLSEDDEHVFRFVTPAYVEKSLAEVHLDRELCKWIEVRDHGCHFSENQSARSFIPPNEHKPMKIETCTLLALLKPEAKLVNTSLEELALLLQKVRGTDGKCCVFPIETSSYVTGGLKSSNERNKWATFSKQAFWEKERWIFPILDTSRGAPSNHYVLVVVHLKKKAMVVFDSLNFKGFQRRAIDVVAKCVSSLVTSARRKGYHLEIDTEEWEARPLLDPDDLPKQSNGHDCGVWVLWALLANLRGHDWAEMDQRKLPQFRLFLADCVKNLPRYESPA
ncbi:hypothetical protein V5O48_014751 [Marasmius crinis-equi]|uniref:Ubiquitin-like protease family profile domain-containing protein n=1 Tax=Marasmius crinis-equi TaxID=585013 RepID=A0ABR3EWH1_9AGAR